MRTYTERLDVIRGWLGEEAYLRLEAAASRAHQEVEAWVVQAILDCLEGAEDAAPAHETKTGLDVRASLPPRPRGATRLTAAQQRALQAFADGHGTGGTIQSTAIRTAGPSTIGALIQRGFVEEYPHHGLLGGEPYVFTRRRVTQAGRDELARLKAEQIAYEQALDEEP